MAASLLARFSPLESCNTVQSLGRTLGKRKRQKWICAAAGLTAVSGRRCYGDTSPKWGTNPVGLNAPEEEHSNGSETPRRNTWHIWRPPRRQTDEIATSNDVEAGSDRPLSAETKPAEEHLNRTYTPSYGHSPLVQGPLRDFEIEQLALDIDYAVELGPAVAREEPDRAFRCVAAAAAANDGQFIASISEPTFSAILVLLQSRDFIGRLLDIHTDISMWRAKLMGATRLHTIGAQHSRVLEVIVDLRRNAGAKLTLFDYEILLTAAKDLEHRSLGEKFWQCLADDGWTPNTKCYNGYMGAVMWETLVGGRSRHKTRVTPFHMRARRQSERYFRNYRLGMGGIRETSVRVLEDMLRSGVPPDEESFCTVILGAALEGEFTTVKHILKNVWEIDVDAVCNASADAEPCPTPMHPTDPKHPTSRLLLTVVRAFGANNDVPDALRLIEYIARHYKLDVGRNAWARLLEWTYVLSKRRSASDVADGKALGQLPSNTTLVVWDTMTRPPYNIEPDIPMLNRVIKTLHQRAHLPSLKEKMTEGLAIHIKTVDMLRRARNELDKLIQQGTLGIAPDMSIEKATRVWEHADLICTRNRHLLKSWLSYFLQATDSWMGADMELQWSTVEVPKFVWEWRRLMGRKLAYTIPTGLVEIEFVELNQVQERAMQSVKSLEHRQRMLETVTRITDGNWVFGGKRITKRATKILKAWALAEGEAATAGEETVVGDEEVEDRLDGDVGEIDLNDEHWGNAYAGEESLDDIHRGEGFASEDGVDDTEEEEAIAGDPEDAQSDGLEQPFHDDDDARRRKR